jgi:hypothetical protein
MPTALWIPTKPAMHSQSEAGHLFRSEAGRGSDLMSATCGAPLRVDVPLSGMTQGPGQD